MAHEIRRVAYFNARVMDEPGAGYRLLTQLAELGINLLAFTAIPVGPATTQLAIFPDDPARLQAESRRAGLALEGPHPAVLVRGDDVMGTLAELHEKLYARGINVYSSTAVSSGAGRFGYLLYLRPDDIDSAAESLGI